MMSCTSRFWNKFLGALGFPVQRYVCFRPYVLPVVVGLCLGITIHMMFVPFFEDGCDISTLRKAASKASSILHTKPTKLVGLKSDVGNDNFEARIIKKAPNNISDGERQAARPKVVRPRYIATELGIREKLFVAVLTSASTVDKLGVAVDKTLSKHVTKVVFFSTVKPSVIPNGLPMVAFGDSHPELLPIHVLRYIQEHYAETFDFYLFISDRTYLRAEKYFELIEHISVKEDVHMGVPGFEKNFCALEGGVLLSQSVMSQVLGKLDWCMTNTHVDNPGVTMGRCVVHASQKHCTSKAGDKTLPYNHLEDFEFDDDIGQLKKMATFNQSLTFYPMPDDISHYKLHRYFCHVDLNDTWHEIEAAKKDIYHLSQYSPGGRDSLTWPLGVPPPFKPTNRFSILQWTYFTDTHLYLDNELTNMKEISGADKLDITDIKKTALDNLDRKYNSRFTFKRLVNGYRRFDPTRGMEYTMDLLLLDRDNHNSETLKRVHLMRPLGKVELVPMPYVTENMMVNLVLPLAQHNVPLFDQFLHSYARTCLQASEDVRLIVVLLYNNINSLPNLKDPFAKPKSLIQDFSMKYSTQGKLTWKVMENVMSDITIVDNLQTEFQTDALVLLTTVNTEMNQEVYKQYLNRVRMNTIKTKQIFFPMGFEQYKPNLIYNKKPYPTSIEIGQRLGQFGTHSYDHSSFYISDYKTARRTLSPSAAKTGDIFSMFITYKNFHVFRAVEPNLRLRWMNLTCDPKVSTEKYQTCVTRNLDGLASQHHLALLIYEQRSEVISKPGVKLSKPKDQQSENDLVPKLPEMLHPPKPKFAPDMKPFLDGVNKDAR